MTPEKIKECLALLAQAIERVTVNTYAEQGALPADEVFKLVGRVEELLKDTIEKDKKMTNFDRIKAMSVEELAKFICDCTDCDRCYGRELCILGDGVANGLVKYLESEVK